MGETLPLSVGGYHGELMVLMNPRGSSNGYL